MNNEKNELLCLDVQDKLNLKSTNSGPNKHGLRQPIETLYHAHFPALSNRVRVFGAPLQHVFAIIGEVLKKYTGNVEQVRYYSRMAADRLLCGLFDSFIRDFLAFFGFFIYCRTKPNLRTGPDLQVG